MTHCIGLWEIRARKKQISCPYRSLSTKLRESQSLGNGGTSKYLYKYIIMQEEKVLSDRFFKSVMWERTNQNQSLSFDNHLYFLLANKVVQMYRNLSSNISEYRLDSQSNLVGMNIVITNELVISKNTIEGKFPLNSKTLWFTWGIVM